MNFYYHSHKVFIALHARSSFLGTNAVHKVIDKEEACHLENLTINLTQFERKTCLWYKIRAKR